MKINTLGLYELAEISGLCAAVIEISKGGNRGLVSSGHVVGDSASTRSSIGSVNHAELLASAVAAASLASATGTDLRARISSAIGNRVVAHFRTTRPLHRARGNRAASSIKSTTVATLGSSSLAFLSGPPRHSLIYLRNVFCECPGSVLVLRAPGPKLFGL